jgi:hypothetical protein
VNSAEDAYLVCLENANQKVRQSLSNQCTEQIIALYRAILTADVAACVLLVRSIFLLG